MSDFTCPIKHAADFGCYEYTANGYTLIPAGERTRGPLVERVMLLDSGRGRTRYAPFKISPSGAVLSLDGATLLGWYRDYVLDLSAEPAWCTRKRASSLAQAAADR